MCRSVPVGGISQRRRAQTAPVQHVQPQHHQGRCGVRLVTPTKTQHHQGGHATRTRVPDHGGRWCPRPGVPPWIIQPRNVGSVHARPFVNRHASNYIKKRKMVAPISSPLNAQLLTSIRLVASPLRTPWSRLVATGMDQPCQPWSRNRKNVRTKKSLLVDVCLFFCVV